VIKAILQTVGLFGSIVLLGACAGPIVEVEAPGVPVAPVPKSETDVVGQGAAEQSKEENPAPKPAVKKGAITELDLNRLLQLQDDGKSFLIDVRPRLFYGLGHVPGAISMPKKSLPRSMTKVQADIDAARAGGKVLVLYCQNVNCPDGLAVAKDMAALGYSVSVYKGGWEEWKEMGF
jgi:rhodanese-related sulfurtransferase